MLLFRAGLGLLSIVSLAAETTLAASADQPLGSGYGMPMPFSSRALLQRPDVVAIGVIPSNQQISLEVVLQHRNTALRDQLEAAQQDRTSPTYHHFLSQQQFVNSFAPTTEQYSRVLTQLTALGYVVTQRDPNRLLVAVTAPASVVASTLGVSLELVRQAKYGVRRIQSQGETIPTSLVGEVVSFLNVSYIVVAHPMSHLVPSTTPPFGSSPKASTSSVGSASPLAGPVYGPGGGAGPSAVINSYQMPNLRGYTGSGHAVGFIVDSNINNSDFTNYMSYYQINRTAPYTLQPVDGGAPNATNSNESLEAALDSQTEGALAPGSQVIEYGIPDLGYQHEYDGFNAAVQANQVEALSASFGGCEDQFPSSILGSMNQLFHQADLQGMSLSASSGDGGVFGCGDKHVSAPASVPDIAAVGGTAAGSYGAAAPYSSQSAWPQSGGGYSSIFGRPAFQNYLGFIPSRGVPDISFPADNVAVLLGGTWHNVGGTSWSSPILASFQVLINQVNQSRRGFVDPALYASNQNSGYTNNCLEDVTAGNTGSAAAGGWDYTTGIGSFVSGCNY